MTKRPTRKNRRRLTKAERLARDARRLADLLLVADDSVTAPHALLSDPRLAIARQFWDDHARRLADLGTLDEALFDRDHRR
jgi:hypothetical protein